MTTIINDRDLERRLIRRRRRMGLADRDEVWNGIYVMSPFPSNPHQRLIGELDTILRIVVQWSGQGLVLPGANISDRETDWKRNYRVPDCCVFLNNTTARDHETHWVGGPDFCVEVASPGERVEEKLPFYASVGVREVLLFLRRPFQIRLMRLSGAVFHVAGQSTPEDPGWLPSEVIPLAFRMSDATRPRVLEIRRTDQPGEWSIPLR